MELLSILYAGVLECKIWGSDIKPVNKGHLERDRERKRERRDSLKFRR